MRRIGEAFDKNTRYQHRPGAYALLPLAGNLLLTHQLRPLDELQLPGGGIDPGEGPLEALHREVFEETGWHIANPRRMGAFRRFVFMPEYEIYAEKICHIYVARPTLCIGPPSEQGHSPVWVGINEAAELLGNPVDRFVTQLL
ncbi:MAG: NUDIX domain-containing protein [Rhodobacteraceae bacterium]|nr:NUDIX domain-containing protein [Paracoccaceae bacterium]